MTQLADDGQGIRCAMVGDVFVSCFYAAPAVERLDFLFEREREWVGERPAFCAITFVDPRVGKEMSGPARDRAKDITRFFDGRMLASCTVVLGSGFFAAIVRSAVTGVQMFASRNVRWHVTSDVEDAIGFVGKVCKDRALLFDAEALRREAAAMIASATPVKPAPSP